MVIKIFILIIIFIILLFPNAFASNNLSLENIFFKLKFDKITTRYYISYEKRRLISSDYPPSSFVIIKLDGKDYLLDNNAVIYIKNKNNTITTLYDINNIAIYQIINMEKDCIILKYKLLNKENTIHKIRCGIVFDLIPAIKEYDIYSNLVVLQINNFKEPLIFKLSEEFEGIIKIGNYSQFKNDLWKSKAISNKEYNAIAFLTTQQVLEAMEYIEFYIKIRKQESVIKIESEDIDFFNDIE